MNLNKNTNEQQWKLLVLLLKEIAVQKLGSGWQTKLASKTEFTQSNISRMFSLKYTPSIKNFLILAKAVEVNFFFEDKQGNSDLNQAFNNAMQKLGRVEDDLRKN
ncbi:helix-turn-helix domain-containing protein [Tenacibaculum soleae]|uniref:helix-turn-helix domain-containing protein n=1 Tax=Tenacibaculum soleae TaxID=447689 RepID=UPI0023009039|nr:helix-turn-helix transcriptional regulator [Tenacibaculum soleae]